jgi:hypothetical protein
VVSNEDRPKEDSRRAPVLPLMPPLTPDTAYRVGLIAQTLTDAQPDGLTLDALGLRTKLPPTTLARVLRVCEERRHVRRDGNRYYAEEGNRVRTGRAPQAPAGVERRAISGS